MKGLIDKVVTVYEMRANAMSVLMANTEKAMEQSEKERKVNEQAERIENFVKGLNTDANNMLTRFYFLKEHKDMTDEQTKTLADFTGFVKTLTKNVCSLLSSFQKSQTFEGKIEKEMKEIETHVKQRLKEFEEVLSKSNDNSKSHLCKYVGNVVSGICNAATTNSKKSTAKSLK